MVINSNISISSKKHLHLVKKYLLEVYKVYYCYILTYYVNVGESDIKSVKEDVPPSTKCLNQHKNHHGNRSHGNRSSHSSEYTKQTQKDKGKFEDNRTRKPDKRNEVVVIVQDRVHKRDNTNGTGQYRRHHHHRQPRNNSRLSLGRNKDTTKPTKNLSEKKVKSIETHSTAPIEIQLTTKQSS